MVYGKSSKRTPRQRYYEERWLSAINSNKSVHYVKVKKKGSNIEYMDLEERFQVRDNGNVNLVAHISLN
jgi:hypothetical protein